ncbi:hypothetical protein [Streptomyces sp. NPDC001068]|uniref:hypothetical protein n=1 Tax=Streptomyces sp. NPDC001068 TaxID=3364544 RepID=UPI0036A52D40
MTTANLAPITDLFAAEDKARAVARDMLPLLAATLRAQYPTGVHLALYRDSDGELSYHSVRTAQGETVFRFPTRWWDMGRFPQPVPAEIAALWPDHDASDPGTVLSMIQQVDQHGVLSFLPDEAMWPHEEDLDLTPVGLRLICPCGAPDGVCAPCCGTEPCGPNVCSACTLWRSR